MNAAPNQQFAHIEAAGAQFQAWAVQWGPACVCRLCRPVRRDRLQPKRLLFYDTDRNGTTARLQQEFLSILGASGYPAAWLPDVAFSVDSHENVERNYESSYFYRLR